MTNFKDPFRCDRNVRSGGVAIYVRESLNVIRRSDLELKDLECVWIQVKIRGDDILICGIYRPPNSSQNYWNLIHESVDRAKSTAVQDIIILGNLNNDLLVNNRSKNLYDLINTYNLKQPISEPTHFYRTSSSLNDIILVNKLAKFATHFYPT